MWHSIFNYELKYWFKSPLPYLFLIVFFGLAFIMILGTGGYFDGPTTANAANIRLLNSPHEINFIFQYFTKFLLFLIPVIVGHSLHRDYKSRIFSITYSFPIPKGAYLFGKLGSALLLVIGISLSIGLALILGEWILGIENPKIGTFNIWGYLSAYGVFTIPNLLFFSILVFVVLGMSRNIYAGFITILLLFLFQIIIENVFTGNPFLVALLDPFGQNASALETKRWTMAEINTQYIPIGGIVLYNRLLWGLITGLIFWGFYHKFDLLHESPFGNWWSFLSSKNKQAGKQDASTKITKVSSVDFDHSLSGQFHSLLNLSIFDFKYIIKSWLFIVFALFGLLALVFVLLKMTNTGEFTLLPVTRIIISTPLFFYSLILILATFLYSGMLVHRAKNRRMNQLIDTTTISNWALVGSKVLAIGMMQIVLLTIMLVCGIVIQIYNGYFHFEIPQYLFQLFIITFPMLLIWAIYAVFVHTLSNNLFLGLFLLILTWLGIDGFEQIGLHSQLLKFNTYPNLSYSDLNAYGQQLAGHFLLKGYWSAFAGILGVITYLLWNRGVVNTWKERLTIAKGRMGKMAGIALMTLIGCFLLLGFNIYKEEAQTFAAVNQTKNTVLEDFKKNFEVYAQTPQPKIDSIDLDIALFPEQNRFEAKVIYTLKNDRAVPIDTLVIKTGFDEMTNTQIKAKHRILQKDTVMQCTAYQLNKPLMPNESMTIQFDIQNKENDLFLRNSGIINNGTYLKQDILPTLGYSYDDVIKEPSDSTARRDNYLHSDLSHIETKISTSAKQIALAPGNLIAQKKEEQGRNHFHYKTSNKVKFNFSFQSAAYNKVSKKYKGITIELYHHPNHHTQLEKMIEGIIAAIDYNTKYFTAYPFDQIRIIEYPHTEEAYTATLMANNIPTSEVLFIINSEAMQGKIDLPFYVMAHELTHQWFGNDLIPADALGAKMLTESITEYISLKIYQEVLGKRVALNFLRLQRERYLNGRTKERQEENPLFRVKSEQQYIAYGKGATAFHALAYYVGEEKVNAILKTFLLKYKDKKGVYPTSLDLIQLLKAEIDPQYHYLIKDFFETITYYENSIDQLEYTKNDDGKEVVNMTFTINKYQNGEIIPDETLNEEVEIGFLDENGEIVQLEKIKVQQKINDIKISVNQKYSSIILNPHYLFIDKN